ncbi:MAG: hypothetical protein MHM6MM_002701 [Cercozoa sp. M6MM]
MGSRVVLLTSPSAKFRTVLEQEDFVVQFVAPLKFVAHGNFKELTLRPNTLGIVLFTSKRAVEHFLRDWRPEQTAGRSPHRILAFCAGEATADLAKTLSESRNDIELETIVPEFNEDESRGAQVARAAIEHIRTCDVSSGIYYLCGTQRLPDVERVFAENNVSLTVIPCYETLVNFVLDTFVKEATNSNAPCERVHLVPIGVTTRRRLLHHVAQLHDSTLKMKLREAYERGCPSTPAPADLSGFLKASHFG